MISEVPTSTSPILRRSPKALTLSIRLSLIHQHWFQHWLFLLWVRLLGHSQPQGPQFLLTTWKIWVSTSVKANPKNTQFFMTLKRSFYGGIVYSQFLQNPYFLSCFLLLLLFFYDLRGEIHKKEQNYTFSLIFNKCRITDP